MRTITILAALAFPAVACAQVGIQVGGGGLGVQAGQVGIGVATGNGLGVNAGAGGVSAQAGVSSGGIGLGAAIGQGLGLGASVGNGGVQAGATAGSLGTGISLGESGVQAGIGTGGTSLSVSAAPSGISLGAGSTPTGGAATATGASPAVSAETSPGSVRSAAISLDGGSPGIEFQPPAARNSATPGISLPSRLTPLAPGARRISATVPEIGPVTTGSIGFEALAGGLRPRAGTSAETVRRCRSAAAAAASRYPVARVDAAAAGPTTATSRGYSAPVEFRIVYARRGVTEARQAVSNCEMSGDGRVLALR